MILLNVFYIPFDLSRLAGEEYVSCYAQRFTVQKVRVPKVQKVRIFQRLFHSFKKEEFFFLLRIFTVN